MPFEEQQRIKAESQRSSRREQIDESIRIIFHSGIKAGSGTRKRRRISRQIANDHPGLLVKPLQSGKAADASLQLNRTQGRRRGRCRRHFCCCGSLCARSSIHSFHPGCFHRIGCSGFPTERRNFQWHVQIITVMVTAAAMARSIAWPDRLPTAAAARRTASITRIIPSIPVPAVP